VPKVAGKDFGGGHVQQDSEQRERFSGL
jgi:hypothetical protein